MPQVSVDQAMQMAAELRDAAKFADAEALYRQILSAFPAYHAAAHYLAIVCAMTGRLDEARDLLQRVLAADPSNAPALSDLGNVFRDQRRFDQAAACFRRAIAIQPQFAVAFNNLGNVLRDRGRPLDAVAEYERAIALQPDYAQAHSNLGNALSDAARIEDAVVAYRRAIQLLPNYPVAHSNLGAALQRLDRIDEALASLTRAVELDPHYAEAWNNLGFILHSLNRHNDAIGAFDRAIHLRPDLAGAWLNLSNTLLVKNLIDDAIAAARNAVRLDPKSPEAHNNLATALSDKGLFDESLAEFRLALRLNPSYIDALSNLASHLMEWGHYDEPELLLRQAIAYSPDYADAHWNLGLLLLQRGDFADGLPEYEWRWKLRTMPSPTILHRPQWDGRPLKGQTVFLHVEQGYGDAIQFIRYVPLVHQRGAKIILRGPPELHRLFASIPQIEHLSSPGDPLPDFDFHCPLLGLPLAFKTDLDSIPSTVPYLAADPVLIQSWRQKLKPGTRKRIGLAWSGDPRHKNHRNRSIPLEQLTPLARFHDFDFYSLQKGDSSSRLPEIGIDAVDHTPELSDFAHTAALIANLDLVISSDTSIVHLAGALAKPVWILLPLNADWRWLLNRADSPWYPTARLFRQKIHGDWAEVIARVVQSLEREI